MTRRTNLATIERDQNLKIEREARAREEDRWLESTRAETVHLATLRGEEIEIPQPKRGEARKPMRRTTGLEWLLRKKRISDLQKQAGDKYGEDYRIAEDVSIRSILNDSVTGASDGPTAFVGAAKARLASARRHGLQNHQGMLGVCNAVCGIGLTVIEFATTPVDESEPETSPEAIERNKQRAKQRQLNREQADASETALGIALDLLAVHYGMAR